MSDNIPRRMSEAPQDGTYIVAWCLSDFFETGYPILCKWNKYRSAFITNQGNEVITKHLIGWTKYPGLEAFKGLIEDPVSDWLILNANAEDLLNINDAPTEICSMFFQDMAEDGVPKDEWFDRWDNWCEKQAENYWKDNPKTEVTK